LSSTFITNIADFALQNNLDDAEILVAINSNSLCDVTYVQKLEALVGVDITPYMPVLNSGRIDKGAKGKTLEILIGLLNNSSHEPDTLEGEIKSFSLRRTKDGVLIPKESIALTMLNPANIQLSLDEVTGELVYNFVDSYVYNKMKKTIYCGFEIVNNKNILRSVDVVDMSEPAFEEFMSDLQLDWILLCEKIANSEALHARYGTLLQTRTKGAGRGAPKTRAFYWRRTTVIEILRLARANEPLTDIIQHD
jgi:DNA mismatch repair protein MutH